MTDATALDRATLCDETTRCMTCGMIGSVSLQPDGNRHSFNCRNCGYVVPCQDFNARADTRHAYCTPGWDDDNIAKPVPVSGRYLPRTFAWGCMTCVGTVTAITWEGNPPRGGLLIHSHGQCERCGFVVRVSEEHEISARFRAFAPDNSRRPSDA